MPDHLEKLLTSIRSCHSYCQAWKKYPSRRADMSIGSYMIMNDFSARRLQLEEMLPLILDQPKAGIFDCHPDQYSLPLMNWKVISRL